MEYSIVIPAYNESDKISSTLTQIISFMRTFSESFEVIVVDDGSKDATTDVVRDYKRENSEILLIKNPHKGKGYALYSGFLKSRGEYIYMADADLSSPITELKKLSVWMKDHDNDVVIASREGVGSNRINEPFYRHLMGRVFNHLVQLMALPGINDSQCGFKLFRREVVKKVFPSLQVYGPDTKELKDAYTGAWDVEVLFLAKKAGFSIKEVPVQWTHVRTNRINPLKDSFRMLMDVIKVRVNDMQGKYKDLHHKAGVLY